MTDASSPRSPEPGVTTPRIPPGRLRAIATVAFGSAVGNLIAFVATGALTRIFTPTQFGSYSVLLSLVLTFSTIASSRLDVAVPLPRDDATARSLLILGAGASTLSLSIGLVACLSVNPKSLPFLPSEVAHLAWTVPVLLLPVATYQLLNAWALRGGRFAAIARRTVVQSLCTAILQIGAGLVGLGVGGLLLGYFLGQCIGSASLALGSGLASRPALVAPLSSVLARYRRFPLLLAPAGLMNSLGLQAPVLLIAGLFGAREAGYFALSQRVLAVPIVLVGQAVAQVYSSELARLRRDSLPGTRELFRVTSRNLAAAGLGILVLAILTAPWAFPLIFGHQWKLSGSIAQAMAVGVGAQLAAYPVSQTLTVFEHNWLQLAWDFWRFAAVVMAIAGGARLGLTLVETVWVYSLTICLFYGISYELGRRILRAETTPHAVL